MKLNEATITLIGAGNMGSAVGIAALAAGAEPDLVSVFNSSFESSAKAAKLVGCQNAYEIYAADQKGVLEQAVAASDVIILGVKPRQIAELLAQIKGYLSAQTLVISLAAGVKLAQLKHDLAGHENLLRAMPNTPLSVHQGAVALMADEIAPTSLQLAREIFASSAVVYEIKEDQVHQVIAAAGSAPAYFYLMVESMVEAAVADGLDRRLATDLVVQTMFGSASLLKQKGITPAAARYEVTSPGGTTAAAIAKLEALGFRASIAQAMNAAASKSRQMES